MGHIISKVMPIFLLILIGMILKKKKFISNKSAEDIKSLVLYFGLPSIIFLTFKDMDLRIEYISLTVIIFLFFCTLFCLGFYINRTKFFSNPIIPYFLPGFSFGTLGIPLFITAFGVEQLPKYAVLGIAHELFIWLVLIVVLKIRFTHTKFSFSVIKDFAKNPFIIALTAGLIINISGLNAFLNQSILFNGIVLTLENLSSILTPLLLIIIGYDLQFNKYYMRESIKIVGIRSISIFILAVITKIFILDNILEADPIFNYAYFTYMILPPIFSLPSFLGKYGTEENKIIATNTIVVNTVLSITIFMVFLLVISL